MQGGVSECGLRPAGHANWKVLTQGSSVNRFGFLRLPTGSAENGLGVGKSEAGKPTERHPETAGP